MSLYLIEILHQTTTVTAAAQLLAQLYLIEILHQTTTGASALRSARSVVSYRNSTSNHNIDRLEARYFVLYLIEILHQTTTVTPAAVLGSSLYLIEILHQTTTKVP